MTVEAQVKESKPEILFVVEVNKKTECNLYEQLYWCKFDRCFFYKYKYNNLTFEVQLGMTGPGKYEVTRSTEEYGFAFVESGSNISANNLKKIVDSINNYALSAGWDFDVGELIFDRVSNPETSKDVDVLRGYLITEVSNIGKNAWDTLKLTEDKIKRSDYQYLVMYYKSLDRIYGVFEPDISARIMELEREEKSGLSRKKRARASNIGLKNIFKKDARFEITGTSTVIYFDN